MSEKRSTSVSLTVENLEYLDREVNNRSAFINDLIEAHRSGKSEMDEVIARHRKQQLESELRTVESREEQIENELELVNQRISEEKDRKDRLWEDAVDALESVPRDPDNPAVKNWAHKLSLPPAQFLDELEERE